MKNTIRLTESQLTKIIKKAILEQSKSFQFPSPQPRNNQIDKKIMGCLAKEGFRVLDSGGKYAVLMKKNLNPTNLTIDVSSQDDPTKFVTTYMNGQKFFEHSSFKVDPNADCQEIIDFVYMKRK